MLSKNFKSNKFYEVTRYVFRYGNEGDKMDTSTTVWDSKEKAVAYIDKYATGTKFAKAYIEEVVVDRDITSSDYKNNRYNKIASQKIYLKNRAGVCKEPIEPIHFYTEPIYKNKTDKPTEEKVYKVYGYARRFDDLTECEKFAQKISTDEHRDVTILSEVIGTEPKTTEIEIIEYEPEGNNDNEGITIIPKFEICVDGKPVTSTETIEGANIIKKALVAEARKHKARDKPPDE